MSYCVRKKILSKKVTFCRELVNINHLVLP
jgi:hypothetical protein